jgi:hypothetical protein
MRRARRKPKRPLPTTRHARRHSTIPGKRKTRDLPIHTDHRPARAGPLSFYARVLETANRARIPFMVGGSWAINAHTGLTRGTKDVDIFCRAEDYPRLLAFFNKNGYETAVEDERWIAKVCKGPLFCDIIFGSANSVTPVTDAWFTQVSRGMVLGVSVRLLPPTELLWSKSLIMDRIRFDGADVAHLILRQHQHIHWKRLLSHMNQYWEVLLVHLLLFRFTYPHMRKVIPDSLLDHLLEDLAAQRRAPLPRKHVCRGRVFSRDDYQIDISDWGMADLIGDDHP